MTRTLGSVRGAAGNGGPYRNRFVLVSDLLEDLPQRHLSLYAKRQVLQRHEGPHLGAVSYTHLTLPTIYSV